MIIILLGAPGSGKGTQAQFIVEKYNIKKISTGDILRSAAKKSHALGKKIKKIMQTGDFVSDEIVIQLIKNSIKQYKNKEFVLDGFPRNIFQAIALKKFAIKINYVIELVISINEIMNRLKNRLIHVNSGRIYHKIYNPPKVNFKDDITGEELMFREDDIEITIKNRLIEYQKFNQSLVNFYKNESRLRNLVFKQIDANNSISEINKKLKKVLG